MPMLIFVHVGIMSNCIFVCFSVHHDEESLFRHHLMKQFKSREDASSSVLSYLSSNIDFVLPDIVSLRSRKTDQDPFNSTYSETKLESLEHIFISDEVRFKRIIIQGEPGSGKSTFLKKITNDWASTKGKTQDQTKELTPYELFLDSVTFVFLVPLDKVVDENDIETVLNKYVIGKDCPVNTEDIVNVIQQQGSNCLFLLDGYDEYSDASIAIDQLIAGETFPNATIVITSQHWKRLTPMISDTFDTIIEIKGFNDEQARRFTLNFMKSTKHGIEDREFIESELWNCLASEEYKWIRTNPQSLLFGCICFLETATISTSRSGLYKDFIQCLYEVFKREKTNVDRKSKKISLATSQKPDPTLQALLVNTGKIAFRCLLGRKQSPKRIPSHWFDQEMYSDFLLNVLELGVIQETKIISRQKDLPVATFVIKVIEEFLAAYYLCNVNDASIVFHEQAAIIELIKAGKIEKTFVCKFLDILVFAAGINPLITCELLTILIPEMESDYIVMGKLSKCAEEMELVEGVGLSLMCLSFDQTISQKLVQLCKHSLEYLTLVNCEVGYQKSRDNDLTKGKEHLCVTFFTDVGNLSNLKFLRLDHVNVDKMRQDHLLLPKLQELVLRAVSPVGGTVKILKKIQSPLLQEVTIDFCDFEDESVSFPNIETLHTLTLGNIKLSRLGWTSLLQSLENTLKLNSLACLNLTILGNDVVFPRLNSLKRLELSGLEFESETSTTKMFTSFNKLRNLEVLEVRAMPLDKLVGHLDVLTHLKRVSFSSIVFSSEIAFSKSNLSNLELHSLSFVAHNGQSFISSMVHLPSLVTLTICYCNFGKENINFLKLKTVKKFNFVNNQMTSNCWCVSVFSLGQLVNIETLEVTYRADEESFVGEVLEDMVDQRSPVPKIVSSSRSGKDKSVTVDFTNKEPLMKTGSCCIQ